MHNQPSDPLQELERERELRQQAEAKNAEYRFFIQTLIDSLPDIVFVKDASGAYVSCNRACANIWGLSVAQVIGNTDRELSSHSDAEFFTQQDAEALRSTKPVYIREMVRFPGGRVVHLETVKLAYRDTKGRVAGIVGVARDVGERRLLHEELKAVRRQLVRSSRVKGELMARIGTEIRGPLNAIIGLSHLMQRTHLAPLQQEYLGKIRGSTQSLLATIGDILDYSKLENHKLVLESEAFHLDNVLHSLGELLQREAEQKGLELRIQVAPDTPKVLRGDASRLGQILHNLTYNAIKFTDKGGVLVLIAPDELGENRVRLVFTVKDTGVGMTAEQTARMFANPADETAVDASRFSGSGFGLAICRQLSEMMGGRISVSSEYGVGSKFTFTAVFNRAEHAELSASPATQDLTGKRVLLVDGDSVSRRHLWNQLTGLGMEVVAASGAAQAGEQAGHHTIDLLLMDWRLPDANGLDALAELRRRPPLSHTPCLLMVTSYGRDELTNRAREAGVDGFLIKPVVEARLQSTLAHALHRGHTQDNLAPLVGETSRGAPNLSGFRVLLAEDDLINREVAVELLRDVGITVDTARNGREAVNQLEHEGYDLVLMDIQMPELDGISATRMIRMDERFTQLPIIAMTVHAMDEDRDECLRVGMSDHVTKPFDPEELYQVLDHWLNPSKDASDTHQRRPRSRPAEGERMPQLPGVDLDLALKLTGGKIEVLRKMLQLFRRNYTQVPGKMHEDLDQGRLLSIFRAAHSLKSAARYIGATGLARQAEALELVAREGDMPKVRDILVRFEQEFQSLLDGIDVFMGPEEGDP